MIQRRLPSLILAAVLALATGAADAAAQSHPRLSSAVELSVSLETIARQAGAAVVEIFSTTLAPGEGLVPRNADLVSTIRASGSGVIVDPSGYIVTNAHVVRGARRLRVEIPKAVNGASILSANSRGVTATIVGIDAETDLAVIKIEATGLTTMPFGDSDDLKAGQIVLALGSPLGLHNSVSMGVVSAVARQLEPESPMVYVQTDAAFNPGSSGGALVDLRGTLVGINTLILSRGGGNEGLGFAAPSNIVRSVYDQIRRTGRVRRGEIGIRAQTVTAPLAAGLGLTRDHGVVLADVQPGSPAARAGLRPGDLILRLDGKPMENGRQLHVNLYRRMVGDVVMIDLERSGEVMTLPVAMSERHEAIGNLAEAIDPRENLVPRLGILGVTLDGQLAELLPALRVRTGVVVITTVEGAIDSEDGGLAVGDIVFAVNRTPVDSVATLRNILNGLQPGESVVLHVERRGELRYLAFSLE